MSGKELDRSSKRKRAREMRKKLPTAEVGLTLAGPTVKFGDSERKKDRGALRALAIEMSKREVLSAGIELEVQAEARQSIEGLARDVVDARKALADGSPWDAPLIEMQEACANYRHGMRARGDSPYVFGEELAALRGTAFLLAELIADETKLQEARHLADKIDLSTALSPIGEEIGTIHVDPPDWPPMVDGGAGESHPPRE